MSEAPQFRDFNELLRTDSEILNAHLELAQDNVVDAAFETDEHQRVDTFLAIGTQLAQLLDHPDPEQGNVIGYRALQFAYQVYGNELEVEFEYRFGEYFAQIVERGAPPGQLEQDARDYLTARPHLKDFIRRHTAAVHAGSSINTQLTQTMLATAFRVLDDSARHHSADESELALLLETTAIQDQFAELTGDLTLTPAGQLKESVPKTDTARQLQDSLIDHLTTFENFSDYDLTEQSYLLSMLDRYITQDNIRLEAFDEDDEIVAANAGYVLVDEILDDEASWGVEVLASDVRLHGKVHAVVVIEAPLYVNSEDARPSTTGLSVALRITAASIETVADTPGMPSYFEDLSPDVEVYLPLTYVSEGMTIEQRR